MFRINFQILVVIIILLYSHVSYAGKKQCQPYLDKLRNIQSQQRQGHSLKRGESLNKREAKARKKWWQCERGVLKSTENRKKKKQSKKQVKLVKRQNLALYPAKERVSKKLIPFQTSNAVVIKSRYQGEQLQAWLKYYQQPKKCARPKTTKQFAICVEDRRKQQNNFEKLTVQ